MKFYRPCVLCYGHDEMLLYTRKCILDREFFAATCSNLSALGEILKQRPLQLMVICQSVPEGECEAAIELARAAWPEIKVLKLQERESSECSSHSDTTMDGLEGPLALLRKIHAMLDTGSAERAPVVDICTREQLAQSA